MAPLSARWRMYGAAQSLSLQVVLVRSPRQNAGGGMPGAPLSLQRSQRSHRVAAFVSSQLAVSAVSAPRQIRVRILTTFRGGARAQMAL